MKNNECGTFVSVCGMCGVLLVGFLWVLDRGVAPKPSKRSGEGVYEKQSFE